MIVNAHQAKLTRIAHNAVDHDREVINGRWGAFKNIERYRDFRQRLIAHKLRCLGGIGLWQ